MIDINHWDIKEYSYDPSKLFFKTKIKMMKGYTYKDRFYDLSDVENCVITYHKYFENQSYLAHNHWLGVVRIYDGKNFKGYIVSTAAGKDDAYEELRKVIVKELYQALFNFDKNDVRFEYKEHLEYVIEKYGY